MQNSFFQKLVLVILAGAATALLWEFYKTFVVGGMEAVNPGYSERQRTPAPAPDPTYRRF